MPYIIVGRSAKAHLDELPLHVAYGAAHVVAVCPELPVNLPRGAALLGVHGTVYHRHFLLVKTVQAAVSRAQDA